MRLVPPELRGSVVEAAVVTAVVTVEATVEGTVEGTTADITGEPITIITLTTRAFITTAGEGGGIRSGSW